MSFHSALGGAPPLNVAMPSNASLSLAVPYTGPQFGGYYGSPITGVGNESGTGGAGFAAGGESSVSMPLLVAGFVLALVLLKGRR